MLWLLLEEFAQLCFFLLVLKHAEFNLLALFLLIKVVLDVVKVRVNLSEVLHYFQNFSLFLLQLIFQCQKSLFTVKLWQKDLWGHTVIGDLNKIASMTLLFLDVLSLKLLKIWMNLAKVWHDFHDLPLGWVKFILQLLNGVSSLLLRLYLGISMELSGCFLSSFDTCFSGSCNLLESFFLLFQFGFLKHLLFLFKF